MGWTTGWDSKADVVKHLLRDDGHRLVDHALVGNVLYAVFRNVEKDYRYIAVFLLGTDGTRGPRNWGYKDMDEGMHPFYYDCPERLLAQSDVQSDGAVKWREACRQSRKHRAEREAFVKTLQKGDHFMYDGREVEFLYRYARGRKGTGEGIAGSPIDKGGTYRYLKNRIEPMPAKEA